MHNDPNPPRLPVWAADAVLVRGKLRVEYVMFVRTYVLTFRRKHVCEGRDPEALIRYAEREFELRNEVFARMA